MIVKPPRMASELSPRLRAIAEHATDQFDPPSAWEFGPPMSGRAARRWLVASALMAGWVGADLALIAWKSMIEAPSGFAAAADAFREQGRVCEDQAAQCRALAANSPSAAAPALGNALAFPPSTLLKMADTWDLRAAGLRQFADAEERKNQGYGPLPAPMTGGAVPPPPAPVRIPRRVR